MIAFLMIVGGLAAAVAVALVVGKASTSPEAPAPPVEARPSPALLRAARLRAAEELINRAFGPNPTIPKGER